MWVLVVMPKSKSNVVIEIRGITSLYLKLRNYAVVLLFSFDGSRM